jgi:hypothetical protein
MDETSVLFKVLSDEMLGVTRFGEESTAQFFIIASDETLACQHFTHADMRCLEDRQDRGCTATIEDLVLSE